jgi:hypothetical protein
MAHLANASPRLPGRPARALAAAVLAAACLGCGESWEAATYPASGRVTINGEPPAGALVQLCPTGAKVDERDSRPWGVVKEDGSYTLATYDGGAGAPAGEYMFTITWPPSVKVPSMADRLGHRYSKPDQSRWKMTIKPGENALPDVEMTNVVVNSKLQQESKPIGPMNLEPEKQKPIRGGRRGG